MRADFLVPRRLRPLLFLLLLAIALVVSPGLSRADTWQRADLYYIDWDATTRVSLTPQRVRELADHKRTYRDKATEIARALPVSELRPAKDRRPVDARLVVDLFTDTGARVTYYASRFEFCNADSTRKCPIDEAFRRRFKGLAR